MGCFGCAFAKGDFIITFAMVIRQKGAGVLQAASRLYPVLAIIGFER